MHPGMVMPALTLDQINNDRRVEEEWNLLRTEQSDEENKDSDDGDRTDIIKKTNLLFSAQRSTALEVKDSFLVKVSFDVYCIY